MATTWRRGLAGLLSVFVFLAGMTSRAHAANAVIPTTPAPFVWIQLDGGCRHDSHVGSRRDSNRRPTRP